MSEFSPLGGNEGYEICDDVSTKCLPKNALKPLGRKGFRITSFWMSTTCLPNQLLSRKSR